MSVTTSTIVLWLFVINLGIAFGAGVYEHRIVVSRWLSSSPAAGAHWRAEAARQDDTGRRFWAFVSTLPLTLLTLANLFAAWRAAGTVRGRRLAAALAALADRLFTFSYFIPTMVGLLGAPDSPESVAVASRWSTLKLSPSRDRAGSVVGVTENVRIVPSATRVARPGSRRRSMEFTALPWTCRRYSLRQQRQPRRAHPWER